LGGRDEDAAGADAPAPDVHECWGDPTFMPPPGTFSTGQNVTLETCTPSASIYYTLDKSQPGPGSLVYVNPIPVTHTETILAVTYAPGFSPSSVASGTYIINDTECSRDAPTAGVATGTISDNDFDVTLSLPPNACSASHVCYTLDGADPACFTSSNGCANGLELGPTSSVRIDGQVTDPASGQAQLRAVTCAPGTVPGPSMDGSTRCRQARRHSRSRPRVSSTRLAPTRLSPRRPRARRSAT
jgi:hypothetical protein